MMTDLRLPLLVLALNLVALGCDAPEKSVGQESDSETSTTGTTSDGCDTSIAACSSESGNEESSSGDESGGPQACEALDAEGACIDAGCTWRDTTQVTVGADVCESTTGAGVCGPTLPPFAGDDCGDPLCSADGNTYWTRELADGVWEVLGGEGCTLGSPDGFSPCAFAEGDPEVCDCLCPPAASLPPGFETELGAAGCVDMHVYGNSPDGSIAIVLATGPGFTPVADAVAAGEPVSTTHDVSAFERLSVLVGTNVTFPQCNDAIDENAYSIDQEWVATAGTVTIEIAPELDAPKFGTQGYATVTITGLEVTLGGVTESVGEVTFADVAVGWLPG